MTFLRREVKTLPNMTHLGGAMYIVRTQAGLRKALKAQFEDWKTLKVNGRPTKYPVLVTLSVGYCGYEYISIHSVHLSRLKDVLAQQGEIANV